WRHRRPDERAPAPCMYGHLSDIAAPPISVRYSSEKATDISTPDAGATIFVVTVMDVRYKPPREGVRE
ncbi:MAG: hypothetical protein WAK55_06050, partial [Xanthobacteraceae bacterium]